MPWEWSIIQLTTSEQQDLQANTYRSHRSDCVLCFQETPNVLIKEGPLLNHRTISQSNALLYCCSVNLSVDECSSQRGLFRKEIKILNCWWFVSRFFQTFHIILWCTFTSYGLTQCPILFYFLFFWNGDKEDHIILLQWTLTWFTADIERVCCGRLLVRLRVSVLEVTWEVPDVGLF